MQTRAKLAAAWMVAALVLVSSMPPHAHAAVGVRDAHVAVAPLATSSNSQLVVEVAKHVIDDLVAAQRSTSQSGGSFPKPELDLAYKLCGDFECLCIDVDPDECVPDADQTGSNRIMVASSLRTPAVLDLVVRELKAGRNSTVKLCSTFRTLHEGCLIVSARDK